MNKNIGNVYNVGFSYFVETLSQDNGTCFYPGDKRHYRAGTVWHPYIPPTGYSTCVTCTCDVRVKLSLYHRK